MTSFHLRDKNGRYYGEAYDPTQRPKRKWFSLRTGRKDVARQRLATAERDHALGQYDPWTDRSRESGVSVGSGIGRFLRSRADASDNTVRTYKQVLTQFAKTLPPDLPVDAVASRHVVAFMRQGDVSAATVAKRYRHVAAFTKWAAETNVAETDAAATVKPPKSQRKAAPFFTPTEVDLIVSTIYADAAAKGGLVRPGEAVWLADVVLFAVGTGVRIAELTGLRWADVDLDHGLVTVRSRQGSRTKSGHDRAIPLVSSALDVARRVHAGLPKRPRYDDLVFRAVRGGRLNSNYVSRRFKRAVRLAELNDALHFHSLRHTTASWLVMRGVPIAVVQQVMGHADIATTMLYSHLSPSAIRTEVTRAYDEISRGEGRIEEPTDFYKCSTQGGRTAQNGAVLRMAA